ncbi:pyroglutamyl-peptidase I [Pasteurellaceae bacterium RH1A]|nr:pyroglutamyl-peptidase I [Pasteurellaceae bacterium RH1A]
MKKILLTGFEAFGGEAINPSWEVVKRLEGHRSDQTIFITQLPCVFGLSLEKLYEKIDEIQPDLVICLGQAGGRASISVEKVAINWNDARIPDNQQNQPIDTAVVENAPLAYFTSLPCKAMVKAMQEAGLPASLSLSAGSYVCNHVMFGLLHHLALHYPRCKGGFIHIPYLPEQVASQANMPSMSLESLEKGLKVAIETALKVDEDLAISTGQIC